MASVGMDGHPVPKQPGETGSSGVSDSGIVSNSYPVLSRRCPSADFRFPPPPFLLFRDYRALSAPLRCRCPSWWRVALVLSIVRGETSVAEAARKHALTVAEIEE
jgi:hypothetical protein